MSGPSFEVFSIDLELLERAVGSRDARLIAAVRGDDDPAELVAAIDAVLVRGARPFVGDTYSLARVVLRMCRALGRQIDANTADVLSQRSLAAAEAVARPLALGANLAELVATDVVPIRGLPIDADMRFGVIDAARVQAAFPLWSRARPGHPTDDDADSLLAEMVDWLEVASARRESLVGVFWY